MGEIKVKVHLENDGDIFMYKEGRIKKKEIRKVEIEALVDTGAVMILLPQDEEFLLSGVTLSDPAAPLLAFAKSSGARGGGVEGSSRFRQWTSQFRPLGLN